MSRRQSKRRVPGSAPVAGLGALACLEALGRPATRGDRFESLYQQLVARAPAELGALLAAFPPADEWRQSIIVEAVAEAGLPEAVPFLAAQLGSPSESVRRWARSGLERLPTRDARRALWEARDVGLLPDEPADDPR